MNRVSFEVFLSILFIKLFFIKEVICDNGEDELEGLFLFVDENKKIRIYDIEKKTYVDVEDNEDIHYLCYFYGSKKYFLSLANVVKEIFYSIMINE